MLDPLSLLIGACTLLGIFICLTIIALAAIGTGHIEIAKAALRDMNKTANDAFDSVKAVFSLKTRDNKRDLNADKEDGYAKGDKGGSKKTASGEVNSILPPKARSNKRR